MTYQIKTINNKSEIKTCSQFKIDQYTWGGSYRPQAYGYAGFLPEKGLYVEMTSMETDPFRSYTEVNSPVYMDSAMEAFFQFTPDGYFNFEINSNGAILAQYGQERQKRTYLNPEIISLLELSCVRRADSWTLNFYVPFTLIRQFIPTFTLRQGSAFTLNFYKIAENPICQHFASYAPIKSPEPNFHLPQFFANAVITE